MTIGRRIWTLRMGSLGMTMIMRMGLLPALWGVLAEAAVVG
jgi:hypothetical protein